MAASAALIVVFEGVSGVIGEPQPRFGPRAVFRSASTPRFWSAMLVLIVGHLLSAVLVVVE